MRWLTEDVPYGLATWASLAAERDVATPLMEAMITLTSAVLGHDVQAQSRTVVDIGLAGLDQARTVALLEFGQW
jgi:opine dehydrogenase